MHHKPVASAPIHVALHASRPALSSTPPRPRDQHARFTFYSPRNRRSVTVPDLLHLAIALNFELDATLAAYLERPGHFALSSDRRVTIAFLTRDHFGAERHYVFLPRAGYRASNAGAMCADDRDALDALAASEGCCLHYLLPEDNTPLAHWTTMLELLAYLPAYATLATRSFIRGHLHDQLHSDPRATLAQLIERNGFPADNVRAVVAAMVHEGSARVLGRAANLDALRLRLRVRPLRPMLPSREVEHVH